MSNFTIRQANIHDIDPLQQIGRETFFETFAASNSEENMKNYLETSFSTEKLTAELNDPASSFYFVQQGERVIGYLKLNTGQAQTEVKNDRSLEIERIYVLNEFHGQKVGQLLFEKALEIAEHTQMDSIWLGVWEENPRAISFYKKNGFVEFDQHVFRLGDDEQTDIMMKKTLNAVEK